MTLAKRCRIAAKYIILSLVTFVILIPFILMAITSFKPELDALTMPPKWLFVPTLENYARLLRESAFVHSIFNSLVIAVASTAIATVISIPGAYAFSRFRFRGKSISSRFILTFRAVPGVTLVIPYFLIWRYINLADTYFAMIVMYVAISLPLLTWMIRSFFMEIPIEVEEAAMVDGCTRWQTLRLVLIPAAISGISASSVLTFIWLWREFLLAMIVSGRVTRTFPVEIYTALGLEYLDWARLSASAVIAVIPAVIFVAIAQKYIVRGLTMGAIKE